jgi:hypothetical protein
MKTKDPWAWTLWLVLAFILCFWLMAAAAGPTALAALLRCLPFGWWHFIRQSLSQLTWNWDLIATGLLCSVLAIAIGHSLLRALFGRIQRVSRPATPIRRWPWRWTICSYAALWLLFVIAFGAGGILRHTTWLIHYHEPWYRERMGSYVQVRRMDGEVQALLMENNFEFERTRVAFFRMRPEGKHRIGYEDFDVILYPDLSNNVSAYVIVPRHAQQSARKVFGASVSGVGGAMVRPISELQQTISQLDAAYTRGERVQGSQRAQP